MQFPIPQNPGHNIALYALVRVAGIVTSRPVRADGWSCFSDAPTGMQATCFHNSFTAICTKDNWPAECASLATMNQQLRSIHNRVQDGRLSEDDGRLQMQAEAQKAQAEITQHQQELSAQQSDIKRAQEAPPTPQAAPTATLVDIKLLSKSQAGKFSLDQYACYYKTPNGDQIARQFSIVCPGSIRLD
jgi:TolA-binding protein